MQGRVDTNKMVDTAYDKETAKAYDRHRFDDKGGMAIHRSELSHLLKALQSEPTSSRLLEVGCGTGRFLEELWQRGYQPTGVDPSEPMLKECQAKLSEAYPEISLKKGEAAKLEEGDSGHDFVYSIRVVNQMGTSDYAFAALKEMARVVAPGGKLLLEYMNASRPNFAKNRVRLGSEQCDRGIAENVKLTRKQVIEKARSFGLEERRYSGSFFLGMTSYYVVPKLFTGIWAKFDQILSSIFPSLCSRNYILFDRPE